VEAALEREDVTTIIEGLFSINATLVDVREHLAVVRVLLGEEPDGEEEEETDPGPD
jgi:hypothetical protein